MQLKRQTFKCKNWKSACLLKPLSVNVSNTLAGIKQTDSTYAFLAASDVDIKCTPNITDEFEAYGQRFRVISVIPRYIQGILTSLDGGLEVIS